MSIRLSCSSFSHGLLSAIIAAPALIGCGAEPAGRQVRSVSLMCPAQGPDIIFFDNFESPVLDMWDFRATTEPSDPAHNWNLSMDAPIPSGTGKLVSDPGGATVAGHYNRLDSKVFSLTGRTNVKVSFDSRQMVASVGVYQVFIRNLNGDKVALIGDFGPKNPSWPNFDHVELPVPPAFWGEPQVRLSLLLQAGAQGGDHGAEVDNVLVTGDVAPSCEMPFFDSFEGDLSKWDVISVPGDPDHSWALALSPPDICAGAKEARSDLAGETQLDNQNRLESKPFSLVGKSSATLQFRTRFQLAGDDRLQVFFADRDDSNLHSLVADYTGQNASFPMSDLIEIPIPADFLGRPNISVAFLVLNGPYGSAFGAAVDDVKILADCGAANDQ